METVLANLSLQLSAKYTVRNGQKSQTLIISNAQWRDVGVYKCIAAVDDGTVIEAQTSLDVLSELYNYTSVSMSTAWLFVMHSSPD